jgi:hypothetical protein
MSRTITLLFRRDPSRDRQTESGQFEGYQPLWPDGQPVGISMDSFCKHGLRLLGLGKHLAGCQEKLVELICMPLTGRDADINRIPNHRVRRFYLQREGDLGRLHFMDGTPTTAVFALGEDEPRVLNWIGLANVADGDVQWLDLAAVTLEAPTLNRPRMAAVRN